MQKLLTALFCAVGLLAQNTPVVTGANPSVELGSQLFNMGTMRVYVGNGAPTTIITPSGTPPVLGDFYLDQTNTVFYICATTNCVSSGWQRTATPTVVSVKAFGVNGSTSDAANLQIALNTGASNFCLYIPSGLTVNMSNNSVSIPTNTCLTGDSPQASKVGSSGLSTPNLGVFDIGVGVQNVRISNIGFDGGVTTPIGFLYSTATAGGPAQSSLVTGSMFWTHGANSGIYLNNDLLQHVGGYAYFSDSTGGNNSNIKITNTVFQNNRPNLFGTGSNIYGSWTGGVLFWNPSISFNHQNVTVTGNTWQNDTGNCLWTSDGGTNFASRATNYNFNFSDNRFVDIGLDAIQAAWIENYTEINNTVQRFGYVITSDVFATRVGGPKWLQGFTPVAFDTYGYLYNFQRNGNVATGNGEMFDLDGAAYGTVNNNSFISCFLSVDPLSNSSSCGPSTSVGVNWTRGLVLASSIEGSTNTQLGLVQFVTISNNTFNGVGNSGIVIFSGLNNVVTGNSIGQTANNGNPIILGNQATTKHSSRNLITANIIYWGSGSGSPAIVEDGALSAFTSSDNNIVRGNVVNPACFGCFEFQHATADASGSGNLSLNSVTPGNSLAVNAVVQQAEGTLNPFLNFYLNNGSGTLLYTIAPGGNRDQVVHFANLPSVPGTGYRVYCDDCTVGSSPCSGGGSGHTAVTNGSLWACN